MSYHLILNPEVEVVLKADPELAIVYMVKFGRYDDERDPLHNPDYVRAAKRAEVKRLDKCRQTLRTWHDRHPEFFKK